MTDTKHTPGPWAVDEAFGGMPAVNGGYYHSGVTAPHGGANWASKGGHTNVADICSSGDMTDDEVEANARLIAAAPELLMVLEELTKIEGPLPGTARWHAKAIGVIAKAKGETP